MILSERVVEEAVDQDDRIKVVKALLVADAGVPIAMTRRRAPGRDCRGAVLLVHGFGQNRNTWHLPLRSPANHLVRAGFDVYSMDLRGHGRSRDLGAPAALDVSDHVIEDIPAAVAEVEHVSGAAGIFLIGHSLGGLLAYAAAPRLESRIAGVVSLGSPYYFALGQPGLSRVGDWLLWLDSMVGLSGMGFFLHPLAEIVPVGRTFFESRLVPLPFRGFAPRSIEPEVFFQHMSRAMDFANLSIIRGLFRAGVRQRFSRTLGGLNEFAQPFENLNKPLLVIAGRHDDLAPAISVKPGYERSASTDKTFRIVAHGHLDMIIGTQAPQTTWPLLESWLGRRCG